jgi:hypothetical protein
MSLCVRPLTITVKDQAVLEELPPGHEKYSSLIRPQVNLKKRLYTLKDSAGLSDWLRNVMRNTAASL